MTNGERFYGKYRGTVVNNVDLKGLGRLQVNVPGVLNGITSWAMPCFPWAGLQMGMYLIPPPQAGVWVEFEQGDPDYPIWVGCWWGDADVSSNARQLAPGTPGVIIQSLTQGSLIISDVPVPPMSAPGVMVNSGPASFITIDATGITITAPTITLRATAINLTGITDINAGALKVT
ncbi:MAG: phage baseplate assembly protein V [Almyronema sp.]